VSGIEDITLTFMARTIRPHLAVLAGVVRQANSEQVFAEAHAAWVSDQSELAVDMERWLKEITDSGCQLLHAQALFVPEAIKERP